ncbi:sigma-70 family RNA polymerase sigma factor [Pedobacter hiemivivus]|uniref:Sigma-70 family RNA polymerase sigma factor n=1 Tax=Pedobacter hiemivivus TaxID=2530454 RepID=A0A4R0NC50_9SPHI|nr:sigma-70 family RNA polymerase sigma factor [Pedobacter hiemivivus]TCC96572.1 sigma-70 family RNA polymerase sigma factor [Pedobacter hiemivivus]
MAINNQIQQQVKAWVEGDDYAFKSVFDYFRPRLLAAALKMVKNSEDAEELVMNVLLKTWQLRLKVADIDRLDDYIFGIMRQQISGFMRKHIIETRSINDIPLEQLGSTSLPELSQREISERYRAALLKLSEQRRKIFLMSREEEMSNYAIAEQANLSVHTVNNHIKASLKVLKKEFQDNPEVIGFVLAVTPAAFPFF